LDIKPAPVSITTEKKILFQMKAKRGILEEKMKRGFSMKKYSPE